MNKLISENPRNSAIFAIPKDVALRHQCIGLLWNEGVLHVGIRQSLDESEVRDLHQEVVLYVDSEIKFQQIDDAKLLSLIDNSYSHISYSKEDVRDEKIRVTEGTVTEIVNDIIKRSINFRASDIHIEPTENELNVRIRVDGKLEDLARIEGNTAAPIISRLKVMAKMNIVERRRPQDGQITFETDGRVIDLRLATVNTIYGEKIVIRVLDSSRVVDDVESLGISKGDLKTFHNIVDNHFGLVVVAGPTGSGKTTTLHSAIRYLNSTELNITTLEDPVEYVVSGVNHVPVDESIGAGFAMQLRAILRQDPDVVLVGETRDTETARIAIQGALSGRLVLTSLHAPDALGVIYRLFQMDIEPHLVAAAVNGIIAQRLVRRICDYCKYEYLPSAHEKIALQLGKDSLQKLAKGSGCTFCRGTGYFDRVGVFQLLEITENLREIISTRPNPRQLALEAEKTQMKTLAHSARELVVTQQTTFEEISFLMNSEE